MGPEWTFPWGKDIRMGFQTQAASGQGHSQTLWNIRPHIRRATRHSPQKENPAAFCFFLRQSLALQPRLALNSCHSLQSAWITGQHHHVLLKFYFLSLCKTSVLGLKRWLTR